MPIEIGEGTVKITAGYALKVPHATEFSTQDAHASISIEAPFAEADSIEEVTDQALQLHTEMAAAAKLAVFSQLNVEFDTTATGVLVPIVPPSQAKKGGGKSSGGGGQRRPQGGGGGGGQRRQGGQSKAAGRTLPKVWIDGVEYFDQRELKDDGTYAQGAADFKSVGQVNGRYQQLWIYSKNGDINDDVAELLEEAGIEY